jgi:cell wall-associated NlpC family hydrolase
MRNSLLFLCCLPLLFASCGTHKKLVSSTSPDVVSIQEETPADTIFIEESSYNTTVENFEEEKVPQVLQNALEFLGTPYRYGGTSASGMDCSGLVTTVFQKENILLPRSSREMSLTGIRLDLNELKPGDLLFFDTGKKKKAINHVGLVTELTDKKIFFIHSTTSRGVIISSLDEAYWQENFVMARRIE